MKVSRIGRPAPARSTRDIFVGEVYMQTIVDEVAQLLRVSAVSFADGARTRLHTHEADQVLVITDGQGIVATEHAENHVVVGDVVLIPSGERHWHGAAPGVSMTHLSILTPGETRVVDEGP